MNSSSNKSSRDSDQVDSLMQSLLSKIPKADTISTTRTGGSSSNNNKTPQQQQQQTTKSKPSSSAGLFSKPKDNVPLIGNDLDLKEIDLITKRLAQDLNTASFLSDDDDDDDSDDDISDDDDDEEEFRKQILREFSNVMNKGSESANATEKVSKQTLKMLYLQLLSQGPTLLSSQDKADKFISKLTANEVTALTELLQKSPDEILQFFNGDEMVKKAIENQNIIDLAATGKEEMRRDLWRDLTSDDLEFDKDEEGKSKYREIPTSVREAIKAFENNALHYSQHPAALLQLCDKLSPSDQNIFLDILYREYTPDKMNQLVNKDKNTQKEPQVQPAVQQAQFDGDLVANVFKEVLTHFRMFKKYPNKFEPLLNKLNEQERDAFDSLVRTFWDLKIDEIKL